MTQVPAYAGNRVVPRIMTPSLSRDGVFFYFIGNYPVMFLLHKRFLRVKIYAKTPRGILPFEQLSIIHKKEIANTMDMKEKLQELAEAARKRIEESDGPEKLNEVKVAYLGKKGELTAILKSMKDVAPEDRPKVGQMVNETRTKIEEHLEATRKKLEEALREEKMKAEVIDVTLPAKKAKIGHRHPNSIALEEVERIFIGMGYEVVEGPEVEYADYNFTKLNIPKDHPARD